MKRFTGLGRYIALAIVAMLSRTASAQTSSSDSSSGSHSDSAVVRVPSTAFEVAGIGFNPIFDASYAFIAPSNASSVHGPSLVGSILTDPLNSGTGDGIFGPRLGLLAGYQSFNQSGSGSNGEAGALAVWNRPELEFGAAVGVQTNAISGTSGLTFNYGAFIEWFPSQTVTLFGKLGECSGGSSGNYLGGTLLYYCTPDIALNASILSASFGSYDFDLTIKGEYRFSKHEPFALQAGYIQSFYSGYRISQVFAGMEFFLNGDFITSSLRDMERNGEPPPQQFKF